VRTYSSFLGRTVVTESGQTIGRCCDLRAELRASELRVTGLVIGLGGRLEHLGIGRRRGDCVPWDALVRIEGDRIVVRDSTEPE
jgi:sporulation protein YlmC with PRC-barrel domain